ncbi:hypothetical protein DACRYDRAFT_57289 [Dacryopinax primogenitus]|uniref:Uncharacterized protein n=1 Tax=Dacryopinax primogenitus (strain DJM 731) TaxID=1858805 RepID=M5FTM3_DACPD|nr:uncharacterized protein DACRYDRAFT_57289 [Dacryopinax primogenitus]EJT98754.1 hypothetical protein DACRYDRAFT_57289 [Dacryopinax primogenitus]
MPLPPLSPTLQSTHALLSQLLPRLALRKPHIPFWHLATHRLPTLALYRRLLRFAPSPVLAQWVRYRWREERRGTSPQGTRERLREWERCARVFERAAMGGDTKLVERYERLVVARKNRVEGEWIQSLELKRMHDIVNRPRLTGSLVLPSPANKPFPRLKPQPPGLSGMIRWRIKARERRMGADALYRVWMGWVGDEVRAEKMLGLREGVWVGHEKEWLDPMRGHLKSIDRSFEADVARQLTPPDPATLERIKQARRDRISRLSYLRQRELRGEITVRSMRRMSQGPPGPVLQRMGEKARLRDRAVRGPGWGGWVGELKRARGTRERGRWSEERLARERRKRGLLP